MKKFIDKCTKTGDKEYLAFSCTDKAMTATLYADEKCIGTRNINEDTPYQKTFEWKTCTKWDEDTYIKVIGNPVEEALLI